MSKFGENTLKACTQTDERTGSNLMVNTQCVRPTICHIKRSSSFGSELSEPSQDHGHHHIVIFGGCELGKFMLTIINLKPLTDHKS